MEPIDLEDVASVGRPGSDNVAVVAVDFLESSTSLRNGGAVITMSRRAKRRQSFVIRSVR